MSMDQIKDYFAFISYKSEDVEWAIWVQHELEHYHLPASFNGRTDVRQNLRPVFRDIDELSAGNLPEQIKQALANSQNLIVICSPKSAKSPWVNEEVKTFVSSGRVNRIFPFIVEGNSPKEFFPPSLQNLPKNEERLGGDVCKNGRDAEFVKIVAGMLGIGYDSLWNRYEKEKAEEEHKQREQKNNLLRLQSRFISEKANALVVEGDYYTASLLSLSVLPKDLSTPDRPYVPEAESVLRKSQKKRNSILKGHQGNVTSVVFSSDDNRILSASTDYTIRVWDVKTGACLNVMEGHSGEVLSAFYNQDDSKIVSASADKTIRIWNSISGKCICVLRGHTETVKCAAFCSDGSRIVSGSVDNTIRIWDSDTGNIVERQKYYLE